MSHQGRRPSDADPDGDGTGSHLRAALEAAEDSTVRYHIRQALQHHLIASDRDE